MNCCQEAVYIYNIVRLCLTFINPLATCPRIHILEPPPPTPPNLKLTKTSKAHKIILSLPSHNFFKPGQGKFRIFSIYWPSAGSCNIEIWGKVGSEVLTQKNHFMHPWVIIYLTTIFQPYLGYLR